MHHFSTEFYINCIATQLHRNLANGTCRLFHKIPRSKSAVSPRTKKAVDLLKVNPNLKVVDAMFPARLPKSEATSKTIHKRVLWIRDKLQKNPLSKLKNTPSILSVVKESSSNKRPLYPITVCIGASTDYRSKPSSPKKEAFGLASGADKRDGSYRKKGKEMD